MSAENFYLRDQIPLSFLRVRAGLAVTGISVTVSVKNTATGATLLASTVLTEIGSSTGIYVYNWTHGQTGDVDCLVTYSVSGQTFYEMITISDNDLTGRSI